jgi:hypothetical protein
MENQIINNHPTDHPYGLSLSARDKTTSAGVAHRELIENGNRTVFTDFTLKSLKKHHISEDNMARRKAKIESLRIKGINTSSLSPYPTEPNTQKGNFAEVILAEYLCAATSADLPIYRLRYNPNKDQSMKGDDVLLFDLDANPARIIVGESKFRSTPSKQAVVEITEGLIRSNKAKIPISLMFVADRLFGEGKAELGEKVQKCSERIIENEIKIYYVGFLFSNQQASKYINRNATNKIHNLLMISLGVDTPDNIVQETFNRLEDDL